MEWLSSIPPLIVLFLIGVYSFSYLFGIKWALMIFSMKVVIGLAQTWFYLHYLGSGDLGTTIELSSEFQENGIWGWLNIGKSLLLSLGVHPTETGFDFNQRTAFFSWLLAPIFWLSGGNPWIVSIWSSLIFCLLVFWSFSILRKVYSIPKTTFWIVFFLPSSLFLASGIQKETFTTGLVLIIIASAIIISVKGRKSYGFLAIVLTVVLYYLRPFLVPPLLIALFFGLLFFGLGEKEKQWKTISWSLVLMGIVLIFLWIHPVYAVSNFWDYLLSTHQSISSRNTYVFPVRLSDGMPMMELIWNSIKAIWIAITGLWLGPASSPSFWVMMTEGLLFLSLILISLRRGTLGAKAREEWALLVSIATFSFLLAAGLGLSSPNYGTLLRYRLAFFLPLMGVLSYFSFRSKTVN